MGYKEKLKDYAEGRLESRDKEKVESDIDRQRAIGDYLEESMDSDIFEESKDAEEKHTGEGVELAKLVQKAVGRKLRKFGICTGAVVLAITLFLMFGLSPIMEAMYYDPGAKMKDGNHNVIDLPLAVYTELHCPNSNFAFSSIDPDGFGNYSVRLVFMYNNPLGSGNYNVSINKGKFTGYEMGWRYPRLNLYFTSEWLEQEYDNSDTMSELEKLPETAVVTACVSFKEDLGLSYVRAMSSDTVHITYVPIRVADKGCQTTDMYFGIASKYLGVYVEDSGYDEVSYPHLGHSYLNYEQWVRQDIPDSEWEKHFTSMLKFMADQKDLNYAMDNDASVYSTALQYVEQNGVKAYGILATAPVQDILNLYKDDKVESIYVLDAKLSSFSR